jgi:gamma-glutamylcyclotransferase (GGCT)/AIG2-like uncharacterized protein YtfP
MTAVTTQLFVYGSLRSGFHHPAFAYMSENFTFLSPGRVRGKLFDMGNYPAALPTGEDFFIVGEFYRLQEDRDFSWVMAQIDDYEGLHVSPGETPLYRRVTVTGYTGSEATVAWIYWYNRPASGRPLIASGDVLQYLQQKHQ